MVQRTQNPEQQCAEQIPPAHPHYTLINRLVSTLKTARKAASRGDTQTVIEYEREGVVGMMTKTKSTRSVGRQVYVKVEKKVDEKAVTRGPSQPLSFRYAERKKQDNSDNRSIVHSLISSPPTPSHPKNFL